ncbi:MAG: ECF transporter S component [Clostridia bacterium]|nr:ECF transporter S component [Clostridia bacterium]
MYEKTANEKTRKLTTLSLLCAMIVVLQLIPTFFGAALPFTLALTPIIIGAALYGWKEGAFLGFFFGVVVFLYAIFGWDAFTGGLLQFNFLITTLLCLLKGAAAGAVAGLLYHPIAKKNKTVAAFACGAVAPVVNTGIFALGMLTILRGFLNDFTASMDGGNPVVFLFVGLISVNFFIELGSNLLLGATIARLLTYYRKRNGIAD